MTRVPPLSLSSLSFSFVRTSLIRLCIFLLLLLATRYPLLATNPAPSSVIANAPVKNLRLPSFNDQGHRTRFLRGDEARYISNTQIDIVGLNLAEFRGDGSTEPVNLLLAPSATVFIKENNRFLVTGKETMRLIGNGIEATGENWSYDHDDRHRLILNKNVRVVIRAPLKGILD